MMIAYRRVSSEDQNLDRQQFPDADKVFEEKASGADRNRPALRDLIDFARDGDEVQVHSLDRLGRDMRDLLDIIEKLNGKGVTVSFVTERLTFKAGKDAVDDPFARLQLHMMAAFAQFERSIIRKRQREGIDRAKARGVYKGRQPTIDRDEVARLRGEGLGATEIAKRLGIGRASVYRLLEGLTDVRVKVQGGT
ncbi:Site-specific DNA recombinase [Albimonas donghaensis]|uniref:Site-specific DNA recombinase n=2 Tax=Albimonas donghaensis TaxID=356660 RepID=A0A1H3A201_9RHOB|nr:Site-specific DNA recombinase [Albimonas donghaensis]